MRYLKQKWIVFPASTNIALYKLHSNPKNNEKQNKDTTILKQYALIHRNYNRIGAYCFFSNNKLKTLING